ncbi:MAG: 6-phosphogluconolactonase [Planctomycetes bacterium]|nr:6-phosphogluconolactonase [Planctomycetota bacterium]
MLAVIPGSAAAPEVHLVLAGGRTPLRAYEILAAESAGAAWSRVHLWWGDERCVPPGHADSNFRAAEERLIRRVAIPAANVHRMCGEVAPAVAAAAYDRETEGRSFDLVLLGMGADGHTLSLFPGDPACDETARRVVASRAPVAPHDRVTMTFPALAGARRIVFAVAGPDKGPALRRILAGDRSLPAARVARAAWIVDAAAASE